jgi:predicted dehydrogenase
MTLDPGHFHAALVHKEMHPDISPIVHIYAPMGPDLMSHFERMSGFNTRTTNPTKWELEFHTGPHFFERMLREKPGNVVMISGRNRQKIDYMLASVGAGLHVLADKPWIIQHEDFPKLERLVQLALKNKRVIYDMMTERFEITNILQRELIRDRAVFGELQRGGDGLVVQMKSVHALIKLVAGHPLRRPAWFFDVEQQGEGLADVGTHLVDLVNWLSFPDQVINLLTKVDLQMAQHSANLLSREDFQLITGETDIPKTLQQNVRDGKLEYFCNNSLSYFVNGIHVGLEILWSAEALPAAGDTHESTVQGTRAILQVRQDQFFGSHPELYVFPVNCRPSETRRELWRWIEDNAKVYPGVTLFDKGSGFRIDIPKSLRLGHEAHFAQVVNEFIGYLKNPASMPAWEMPNLLAKYYITTKGVALAREAEGGQSLQPKDPP